MSAMAALAPPESHHAAAMAAGARCDLCPLRNSGRGPVPPSIPDAPAPIEFLVVAEAPGSIEIEEGRTLVGPSGREIRTALRDAGLPLDRVSFTNTLLCQPPGGDLDRYLQWLRKVNKAEAADPFANTPPDQTASPIECCRPRLKAELARTRYAILMGGASLIGVGLNVKIMKVRGTPVQIPDGPPAMPVPHAAFVMRDASRTFRPVFRADVAKGVRIAYYGTTWRDPSYFVASSAQQLANFLAVPRDFTAVDTETDDIDPWTCRLRRIGFGTGQEVAIYSPLSVRGHPLLAPEENAAQKRVIAEFLGRGSRLGFHNYYCFDSIVLNQHGLPVNDNGIFDSLVAHRIGATSELPHGLDFLGSVYTDAPHWKDAFKHSKIKDDAVLDRYLSFDIAVTALAGPQVAQGLVYHSQVEIYNLDAGLSIIGRGMAALGVRLDRAAQWKFASEYQEKADRLRGEFVEACGRDVNPRSYPQIVKLLYQDLGLPILQEHTTDTGEPSSAEPVLLELLGMGLDKRATKIIHTLLGFREADKILGTYTGRIERTEGDRIIEPRLVDGPPLHVDGRLRVTWSTGKTSGRWGSGDPMNLTNVPKKLRAMFVPAPGNVFVAADFSAIELRILALLAEDEILIEAFRAFDAKEGPDVHIVNACTVFRCQPKDVTDEVRNFIKRFVYGLSYGAGPPKIHQTLSLLRDDDLKPLFPHITLSEVERVYNLWWAAHPKMPIWQKNGIKSWRKHGFMETPWHKRKRYFIGGENAQEMANFRIQGGAADLQNQAVRAFVGAYPFDYTRNTGLVFQVHDQLVAECLAADAERVKQIMEWAMVKQIGPMRFPAAAKIGADWKVVS